MLRKKQTLLVVGGNAAGCAFAAQLKRNAPHFDITILEQSDTISYGICELPYVVDGRISSPENLIIFSPEAFEKEKGVKVFIGTKVISVDTKKKIVTAEKGTYQSLHTYAYDYLVLSTGSSPKLPDRWNLPGVFSPRSFNSALQLERFISTYSPTSVAIIGAGPVGLEYAESFRVSGKQVFLLDQESLPGSRFFSQTQKNQLAELLIQHRIQFIGNSSVKKISHLQSNKQLIVELATSQPLSVDLVINATGYRPNTDIQGLEKLRKSGHQTWIVNSELETSEKGIFAIGDCAQINHRPYVPMATTAAKMGRHLADYFSGHKHNFPSLPGTIGIVLFDQIFSATGDIISKENQSVKIEATDKVKLFEHPTYFPVMAEVYFHPKTKQIKGATWSGPASTASEINLMVTAIQQQLTVSDVENLDLLYTPLVGTLWHPWIIAARKAKHNV